MRPVIRYRYFYIIVERIKLAIITCLSRRIRVAVIYVILVCLVVMIHCVALHKVLRT